MPESEDMAGLCIEAVLTLVFRTVQCDQPGFLPTEKSLSCSFALKVEGQVEQRWPAGPGQARPRQVAGGRLGRGAPVLPGCLGVSQGAWRACCRGLEGTDNSFREKISREEEDGSNVQRRRLSEIRARTWPGPGQRPVSLFEACYGGLRSARLTGAI